MVMIKRWDCDRCDWYSTQFVYDDSSRSRTSDRFHIKELVAHKQAVHSDEFNPLTNLWSKRNTPSMANMPREPKWWQFYQRWAGRLKSEN